MSKRIIIAGGGTGGHIFPAVAVANALRKLDASVEIMFVGAKGKMEMEKVPQAGYQIVGLDIAGFNRSALWKNIMLPYKLAKSFLQVRKVFMQFKPDAAFGVGGYSSFPVLRYAQWTGVPTFLHEANAFAGKSNMMLGKKAQTVFVASEGMEKFFPSDKIVVSGNPVRSAISKNIIDKATAVTSFGLSTNKPVVLSVGGSLGARSINVAVQAGLDSLLGQGWQLIWQTGKLFTQEAASATAGKQGVWASDFIEHMDMAYAAADVVISRAGAMSVAELCVCGKPAVLVPYPFAAEDHQTANARMLANAGAADLVPDAEAGNTLMDTVAALLMDKPRLQRYAANMKKLARYDADELIAKHILNQLHD
jgi:UDP-N-acetylglucosamine--N-acetylmuramyl-(pentapeptide) pyrophosphoryl-undecaprenol N-acetylglucosamine transferase